MTSKLKLTRYPLVAAQSSDARRSCIVMMSMLTSPSSCTRPYYRRQADREVNCIIDNKSMALGEAPGEFRIDVDPQSRMFDPQQSRLPADAAGRSDLAPVDELRRLQAGRAVLAARWARRRTSIIRRGRIICRATRTATSCSI